MSEQVVMKAKMGLSICLLFLAMLFTSALCVAQPKPQLVVAAGHSEDIEALAISPDGKLIGTGSQDGTLKLWEVKTGDQLRTFEGYGGNTGIAFSNDGKILAAGGLEGNITLWKIETGEAIKTLKDKCTDVGSVTFSPDDKIIASGCHSEDYKEYIELWDVTTGAKISEGAGTDPVAFSPNGRLLAARSESSVRVWEVTSGRVQQFPAYFVGFGDSLSFSPDNKHLVQASDQSAFVWNVETGQRVNTFTDSSGFRTVLFVSNGEKVISVSEDGNVQLRNTLGQSAPTLIASLGGTKYAAIGLDGGLLATINRADSEPVVNIWKMSPAGKLEATGKLKSYSFTNSRAAMDTAGTTLAISGGDASRSNNKIKLWDLKGDRGLHLLADPDRDSVRDLTFNFQNTLLAYGTQGANIEIWDPIGGTKKRSFQHNGGVTSTAFDRSGTFFAAGDSEKVGQNSIKIWNVKTGRSHVTIPTSPVGTSSLVFSPDGRSIVQGDAFNRIRVWNTTTGKLLKTFPGQKGDDAVGFLTFALGGKVLISSHGDGTVIIWNWATGRKMDSFKSMASYFAPIALSPDGSKIGFRANTDEIAFYDLTTKIRTNTFAAPDTELTLLGFACEGKYLVVSDYYSRVRLWEFSSGKEVATLSSVGEDDWLVTTPEGLFDGTPAAWKQLFWRFDNNTFSRAPVEAFFNEFFYPGLLQEILQGRMPKPSVKDLSKVDIRQPNIAITVIDGKLTGSQKDILTADRTAKVRLEVTDNNDEARQAGVKTTSGAQDLRLFRNGSLVRVWKGDVLKGQPSTTLEATIPIIAGENRLTAYAFNADNVKSSDATLTVNGADTGQRKGVSYILAIGLDKYANTLYELSYAVADAKDFASELKLQQEKLGTYDHVEVVPLTDLNATKANILKALADISAKIQPEDSLTIYFAGHGTAQANRFYLIPHDLGYMGSRTPIDNAGLQTILAHSISDEELEAAVEGIDAGQMLLVIDACNSGQALEAEEKRRGPMNSKGLAQLAYEKGMYILTAAQSYQAAQEATRLGHGFLTYSLVEEGLKTNLADREPKDGQVLLREWLDFATSRVPQIQQEELKKGRKSGRQLEREDTTGTKNDSGLQHPRVFYRRETETHPMVVAKP